MTIFLSSSADEDDNLLGVPSSPSAPSITGFDSENQSATSDDVVDKAHGHRWLKAESHFPSSPSTNVADKPRGQHWLKAQRHLRSLPSVNVADRPRVHCSRNAFAEHYEVEACGHLL
jgi:hypothetical protein